MHNMKYSEWLFFHLDHRTNFHVNRARTLLVFRILAIAWHQKSGWRELISQPAASLPVQHDMYKLLLTRNNMLSNLDHWCANRSVPDATSKHLPGLLLIAWLTGSMREHRANHVKWKSRLPKFFFCSCPNRPWRKRVFAVERVTWTCSALTKLLIYKQF